MKYKWNKSTRRIHYTAIKFVSEKMQRGKHTKSNIKKWEWNRILDFLKPLGIHYCTTQHNHPDDQNPNFKKYPGQNLNKINWVKNWNGQETSKPFCASTISWAIAPFYTLLLTIKSRQQILVVGFMPFTVLCPPFSIVCVHHFPPFLYTPVGGS